MAIPAEVVSTAVPAGRRWLNNVATGYSDIAFGGVIYVLLTPVLVQGLGVEAYALWVLSHTVTFYLGLMDLGLGPAHVRFHALYAARGRQRRLRALLATVGVALMLSGVLAAVAAGLLALSPAAVWLDLPGDLAAAVPVVLLLIAVNVLFSLPGSALENVYEGEQRFDLRNLRSIVLRLLAAGMQLALLLNGFGIVALVAVELGIALLRIVIDVCLVRRLAPQILARPFRGDRRLWRRIRPFALWAFVDDLLVEGSANLDKLLLVVLLPVALLTPYVLCVAIATLLLLVVRPVAETLFPMASGFHARGRTEDLVRVLVSGTRSVMLLTAPLALVLILFGEGLLLFWVPTVEELLPTGLLALVVATFFVAAVCWPATLVLMALGRMRLVVVITLAELALIVVLALLLVPPLGLNGFALATLSSNLLAGVGLLAPAVCRVAGVRLWWLFRATVGRVLLPVAVALLVAVPFTFWREAHELLVFTVAALVVAGVYLPLCYLAGMDHWDREQAHTLMRRLLGTATAGGR